MRNLTEKHYPLLIYAALTALILIAFSQVLQNDFVSYDDDEYVTENKHVRQGLTAESIRWAFGSLHGGTSYWHPLTWLSHMLDCHFFGLEPSWHHLTNVILHIANTLLLFALLRVMTGALWPSAFVAAVFALHPLRVESVAWVAERKDVLSTLFWMLTLAAYVLYTRKPDKKKYLLVAFAFILAIMAKPTVVTLPFVLLLLDYWPLQRMKPPKWLAPTADNDLNDVNNGKQKSFLYLLTEKIPLIVLSILLSIVTLIAQHDVGAMVSSDALSFTARAANATCSYMRYIGKMAYPTKLAVLYPYSADGIPLWQVLSALAALVLISLTVIYIGARRKYLITGWFWYFGTLIPVIGLIQVGSQAMADRYTYVSAIGISIIIAWTANQISINWPRRKTILTLAAATSVLAMMFSTLSQVKHWQNSKTLFKHAIDVTEDNVFMLGNYGNALAEDGKHEEAIEYIGQAVVISPDWSDGHADLAHALYLAGRLDEADEQCQIALTIEPSGKAYYVRALTLNARQEHAKALEVYHKSIDLKPTALAYMNLANTLHTLGRSGEAVEYYYKAIETDRFNDEVRYNLGFVYYQTGNLDKALSCMTETLRFKPDHIKANRTKADILYKLGQVEPAIEQYYKTLQFLPDNTYILNVLAWLLATSPNPPMQNDGDAVNFAEKACRLTGYAQYSLIDTLAAAYAANGDFKNAIKTAEKAIDLARPSADETDIQQMQDQLELYKANKPYRTE